MPDFNKLFDEWAKSYDKTVYGTDNEYVEVFQNYEDILKYISDEVADKNGIIVEIGVGTGNLTKLLYEKNLNVVGIEPSKEMRKIAKEKLPNIDILDGHFLSIPIDKKVDAIVTSYAFHHLTYDEKKKALEYLDKKLNNNGKIVIADTMFESIEYKKNLLKYVELNECFNLLNDLKTEYYELLDDLCVLFKELNYSYSLKKMNKYVWVISAVKGGY
ncbi:methyltransferase [Caloranaerobacter sp. TR13]|uniref:class I SAM-dependent methyltransferase n=1 Tax=Caloranaerobacter sp. TR13 TaxID=1302151 RepID=UPI0006D48CB1|nr:class I SAM-dependent methyltransferase [Caloranaerobacter sp. TR13]KPU27290.1 methyltransferase [Caloranaerobacter sp. TR13]